MAESDGPEYDPAELRSDLARIREKLKRLDGERLSTLQQLERAMAEAERLLAERREPPPSTGL
jgi:hypothetical protein